MSHRSRVCYLTIDCDDLDEAMKFWSAALNATSEEDPTKPKRTIYRKLRLPDSDIRLLLQHTTDQRTGKNRMHLDIETDDVEAEVERLEALGAVRHDHQQLRGYDFWVMLDPWGNEFCVLEEVYPDLLAERPPHEASKE